MQFALVAGLQIRRGDQVLQMVRELEDGQEIQFENLLTKRPSVMRRGDLIRQIYKGDLQVVWAEDTTAQSLAEGIGSLVDISSLPEKYRSQLELRLGFVRALIHHRVSRGQREKVTKVVEKHAAKIGLTKVPSASAVMDWVRRFQKSDCNPVSLLPGHRNRRTKKRIPELVEQLIWDTLRKHYFTLKKYSARHAFRMLGEELKKAEGAGVVDQGEASVAYPTFCRRILETDLYHRVASREGIARARMVCRTAFPDGVPTYPYQRVEIDHTPLNWVVMCERTGLPLGRPTLTVALDAYSGYVLGMYLSFYGPGATSLAGVLRSALQPKDLITSSLGLTNRWLGDGLPDEVVVDNGLEFHSFVFKMIAMSLGFDVTYCRVRTPWLKPRVERFFNTLNTLTLAAGRVSKVVANVARVDPYRDALITFNDLVDGLVKFVVDVYPFEPNWRKMSTPAELFAEGVQRCPPSLFPGNLDQLKLASAMSKALSFGPGGVELMGLPYGSYTFKDIADRYGSGLKLLCKWDPDDISRLYVQDPSGHWHEAQCRWSEYASGLSHNQHQQVNKHARAYLQSSDRQEALLRAKQELHEHWLSCTRGRSRSESLKAARTSGLTSLQVLDRASPAPIRTPMHPEQLVTTEDLSAWMKGPVPTFESFMG